jgi:hypothetical protein
VIPMVHKLGALLWGVPKYITKLTINLSLPLTSITCSVLLPIWAILLPMPTLLLLQTAVVNFESLTTILSWGAHIPLPITLTKVLKTTIQLHDSSVRWRRKSTF